MSVAVSVMFLGIHCTAGIAEETMPDGRKEVLVLGNSITHTGKAPKVGWTGSWGMAASAATKDFVSVMQERLRTSMEDSSLTVKRINLSEFESAFETFSLPESVVAAARSAFAVVVELGDNARLEKSSAKQFKESYVSLLSATAPGTVVVCVSTWWPDPVKDAMIRAACDAKDGVFVDISEIANDPRNRASSERKIANVGVGAHPGDRGMSLLGNAVADAIRSGAQRRCAKGCLDLPE